LSSRALPAFPTRRSSDLSLFGPSRRFLLFLWRRSFFFFFLSRRGFFRFFFGLLFLFFRFLFFFFFFCFLAFASDKRDFIPNLHLYRKDPPLNYSHGSNSY